MFAIGDKDWPGVSKLNEECGEVVQVIGKLMGTRGAIIHWDGSDLKARLEEEIADVMAAAQFVDEFCGLDSVAIRARMGRNTVSSRGGTRKEIRSNGK